RQAELGRQLAARPPEWALNAWGVPPQEPGALREDWERRAAIVESYRESAGITDPAQAIGPVPAGQAQLREAFHASVVALELPGGNGPRRTPARPRRPGPPKVSSGAVTRPNGPAGPPRPRGNSSCGGSARRSSRPVSRGWPRRRRRGRRPLNPPGSLPGPWRTSTWKPRSEGLPTRSPGRTRPKAARRQRRRRAPATGRLRS